MAYEVYEHRRTRKTTAFVRFVSGNMISMSKPCREFLTDAEHVHLLVDSERQMAAIAPCKEDMNSYRLGKNDCRAWVTSKSFLAMLGIEKSERISASLADGMVQFCYGSLFGNKDLRGQI